MEAGLQGHPLTSYAFALSLDKVLKQVDDRIGSGVIRAIQDDMCMAGQAQTLIDVIPFLSEQLASIGLEFAHGPGKNCMISPTKLRPPGLPHFITTPEEGQPEGFELCGTPVGDDDFCVGYVNDRAGVIVDTIRSVVQGDLKNLDAHTAFHILERSHSFVAYWLYQTNPPAHTSQAAQRIEQAIRSAFHSCTGINTTSPNDRSQDGSIYSHADRRTVGAASSDFTVKRIFQPLRFQGCGINLPVESLLPQSFFVSNVINCASSMKLVSHLDPVFQSQVIGACDLLNPIIGDPKDLSTFLSHSESLPLAAAVRDATLALRVELEKRALPLEVSKPLESKYMFARQASECHFGERLNPLRDGLDPASLEPYQFAASAPTSSPKTPPFQQDSKSFAS